MSRRVAVILHQTVPWIAGCIDGIRRYSGKRGHWHLLTLPPGFRRFGYAPTFPDVHQWKGDGIIGLVDDESELRAAAKAEIPVVNLGSWLPESFGVPRVTVDHYKGGQLAAEHLLGLGLRRLAVFGWGDAWYLNQRRLGFCERAAEAGVESELFLPASRDDATKSWHQRIVEASKWLATLPRPCGVFAMHDCMAQFVSEGCHEANLRIPDDIALVAMDNDEAICEHLVPPITSVSRNSGQVGWEAAALLDRMMQGEATQREDLFVEPDRVVTRQSTDKLYSADPVVQRALDYLRAHLRQPFNVEQLADHLGVSKRTLEMRFREKLNSSPHDFVTRLRVRHAQALMQRPQEPTIEQIALQSGFGSVQAFRKAFRRITGESLVTFRKKATG